MKLIVIKGNLRGGFDVVEKAVGVNQNLPILQSILFSTDQNILKLTATNLELAITTTVLGKIIEPGKIVVPTNTITEILHILQNERLNIETKKGTLELTTDNYEAHIPIQPADDFPIIPTIQNKSHTIEIDAPLLCEALQQVVASAQFSELRPELSSVLMVYAVDQIKLVATDSFRLAERTISANKFKTNHKEAFRLLLPLKTAHEVLRVFSGDEKVKIFHDETQILFTSEKTDLISRLTDGAFPDYEYLIPKKFETEAVINREEFLQALRLASVFSAKSGEVHIRASEQKKHIEIASTEHEVGENKYILNAKISGAAKDIAFNWRYLSDALKTLKTETVFLGMNEDNKPALLRSPSDASYFSILMPILHA